MGKPSGEGHFCGAAGGIGVAEREIVVVENGGQMPINQKEPAERQAP